MAGIAQVWLTEDELDMIVKAVVRYVPRAHGESLTNYAGDQTRQNVLDKLRPLAYGVACEVSSEGGAECVVVDETGVLPSGRHVSVFDTEDEPLGACEGDLATELK